MSQRKVSRRHVLRGAGGVAISLPLLEVMLDGKSASAQTAAVKRYFLMFHGGSIANDGEVGYGHYVPSTVGGGYGRTLALGPLFDQAVNGDVSVVSGLYIPEARRSGGNVPPGGRRDKFHNCTMCPLLTGVRTTPDGGEEPLRGPSSDWLLSSVVGPGALFNHVTYRVQPSVYKGGSAERRGTTAAKGTVNNASPILPTVSPQAAWRSLFGNFTPPSTGGSTGTPLTTRMRSSVLDLVRRDTEDLVSVLGTADRRRMDQHLTEIRELEQRVATTLPPTSSSCVRPADPGPDPAIGTAYSNELKRAEVLRDLLYMAYVCDLVRTSSLCVTMAQSFMSMQAIAGFALDLHETSHNSAGTNARMAQIIAWHVGLFANLVRRFKDTTEAGVPMLNNMAMIFCSEGGHGFNAEDGQANRAHSTENMVVLVAGRAGGLQMGRHLVARTGAATTTGMHPARAILTAMRALGYASNTFGEVSGEIPGLRV